MIFRLLFFKWGNYNFSYILILGSGWSCLFCAVGRRLSNVKSVLNITASRPREREFGRKGIGGESILATLCNNMVSAEDFCCGRIDVLCGIAGGGSKESSPASSRTRTSCNNTSYTSHPPVYESGRKWLEDEEERSTRPLGIAIDYFLCNFHFRLIGK